MRGEGWVHPRGRGHCELQKGRVEKGEGRGVGTSLGGHCGLQGGRVEEGGGVRGGGGGVRGIRMCVHAVCVCGGGQSGCVFVGGVEEGGR